METRLYPPEKGGRALSQFSEHFYCGQTDACIKMPLCMYVGLSPGDLLDGDPVPLSNKLKLPKSQTGGKGIVKTCTTMRKGMEVNENIGRKPPPLRSEVARAIRQTASRNATGPDDVPAELFKAGEETALDKMHRICVAIYETGEWPEGWTFSTYIPLPKKGDLRQCENYRTIALVFHASKILLRIILDRIRVQTETEIADQQAGFRQGRGTI